MSRKRWSQNEALYCVHLDETLVTRGRENNYWYNLSLDCTVVDKLIINDIFQYGCSPIWSEKIKKTLLTTVCLCPHYDFNAWSMNFDVHKSIFPCISKYTPLCNGIKDYLQNDFLYFITHHALRITRHPVINRQAPLYTPRILLVCEDSHGSKLLFLFNQSYDLFLR